MDNIYTLITGGSRGIGKALALECAARGMNLLLVSLPEPELEETAQELRDHFPVTVHTLALDLSLPSGPEELFRWCKESGFRVNILINNAGATGTSVFLTSTPEYNDARVMVNVRALVLLTRLFMPLLLEHEKACIMNISSMAAFFTIPYKAVYAASKAFVLHFSRALRLELSGTPVSVTCVCPNGVVTNEGTAGRIAAHGALGRITSIEIGDLAKKSLDSMLRGKELYIPKPVNRLILVLGRLIPWRLAQLLIKRRFAHEVRLTGL